MFSRARVNALVYHFLPDSLSPGQTAFPALSAINLAEPGKSKADLDAALSERFEPLVAKAFAVKILNLFLARHQMQTRASAVASRPFGLVIDPSNVCELACPGCVHSERNEALKIFDWPKGTLSEARLAELLKQYGPYAVGAYFCNYGEPLLNLRTPHLIRMAKTYLMGTALSTSLSVRKLDAEAYVESGLDFMVMSIDGATQPVYQQFRRNGDLELVFGNIRKLVEAKRKLGRKTPVLSWNFLAFEHNVHELALAERTARKLGVNQFRIVNPFDVGWDDPEIRPASGVKGEVRRLDSLSFASEADNWNPFPESLDAESITRAFESHWDAADSSASSGGHTCHWLYKNMIMDATGRIMPCCGGPRPDTNLVFGRFDGNTDVFNSPLYREARAHFAGTAAGAGSPPHCTQCEWDHTTVNIGSEEIRRYFRAADPAFFDRASLRLLSDW